MNYIPQVFIFITPPFCLSQPIQNNNPDPIIKQSFKVTGGNFSNSDGGVSYSVSQVFHSTYNGEKDGMQVGVQLTLISHLLEEKIFNISSFSTPGINFNIIEASSFLNRSLSHLKKATEGFQQKLSLLENTTISGGNSFSFENWNTTAEVNRDGQYSSLNGAPKVYTLDEIDTNKAKILGVVSFFTSINFNSDELSNTLACKSSTTFTNTSKFSELKVEEIINLEVSTTKLTVSGGSEVIINAQSGCNGKIENDVVFTRG